VLKGEEEEEGKDKGGEDVGAEYFTPVPIRVGSGAPETGQPAD